jgi:uroporphyrinogen III methyltransferase/synthase
MDALAEGKIQAITFTSSSTVENFFDLVPLEALRLYPGVKLACIGPVTAKTLTRYGFRAHIQPEDYTIPGLAAALADKL